MTGEATGLVEAQGLRKTYKGGGSGPKGGQAGKGGSGGNGREVRALDGLSFSVPAGTVYALLGPNGAGKANLGK